jgi:hypothetical protein
MKTSLNDVKTIDDYLLRKLGEDEMQSFETELRRDEYLRLNVFLQRKIHRLLTFYRRDALRSKADQVHNKLFNSPAKRVFQKSIADLF